MHNPKYEEICKSIFDEIDQLNLKSKVFQISELITKNEQNKYDKDKLENLKKKIISKIQTHDAPVESTIFFDMDYRLSQVDPKNFKKKEIQSTDQVGLDLEEFKNTKQKKKEGKNTK